MVSLIIPSYRNPECLDICLESALEGQSIKNQIIVILDGFAEESKHIVEKYQDKISFLNKLNRVTLLVADPAGCNSTNRQN